MHTRLILCYIVVWIVGVIHFDASAQTFSMVTYSPDDSNFPNPERGFYIHTEAHSADYTVLQSSTLQSYREDGITLVLRIFYLEDFVSSDISGQYLENIRLDFQACRQAGIKLVIRFAYTRRSVAPYGDAAPEQALSHIRQLTPVLRENSDVIAILQAGFIGAWGEWYYTDHFTQGLGNITEANWQDRKALVQALLEALPANRVVQVRTPGYKRRVTGSQDALTAAEAFGTSPAARVAHHNDCFVASPNDMGTYINIAEEKNYLEQETRYLPIGGETCAVYPPYSECPNALAEMERFHWSYLNIGYHSQVLQGFETGGCMNDMVLRLGHRFRLAKSRLQLTGMPGGSFDVNIALLNEGWANVYNPRTAEVVLRNIESHREYFFTIANDVRKWPQGDSIKIQTQIGLPEDMEEGSYAIYLNLPDSDPRLYGKPEYAIRMASVDVWEADLGYNNLKQNISISHQNLQASYSGDHFFIPRNKILDDLTPTAILATASANDIIVYWGTRSDDPFRVLERSQDGGTFTQLAIIPGDQSYFRDTDVVPGQTYSYRYFFTDLNGISETTAEHVIVSRTSDPRFYAFANDGDAEEWRAVAPVATVIVADRTYATRFFADQDSLHLMIEGDLIDRYAIFMDTDNKISTGQSHPGGGYEGFDYLLRNDSLYQANTGIWTFKTKSVSKKSALVYEVAIALADLHNISGNTIVNVTTRLMFSGAVSADLPLNPKPFATFYRELPPATPVNFTVTNSTAKPESMLIVQWADACQHCQAFVLERSTGSSEIFQEIYITPDQTIYRDENLVVGTTYHYRLASFNSTGQSPYTSIASGTPNNVIVGLASAIAHGIEVFPNPVDRELHIRLLGEGPLATKIRIFDSMGRQLTTPSAIIQSGDEDVYQIDYLPRGIYLLRIERGGSHFFYRLLK
jgi:hypothetical protein